MSLKLLNFSKKTKSYFEVTVQVENETKKFDVSIIDNEIFGIQCPGEMQYLFHRSAKESQKLIADIKQKYLALKKLPELQVA